MRKIIVSLVLFSLLSILIVLPVYASEGLIKPSSKFYFLQTWGEQIKYFFIRSPEQKLNYLLALTERRIEEMESNPSVTVSNRYENHYQELNGLTNKMQNKQQATERIRETNLAQQQVLSQVYSKVPESAKLAIINAQENSSKHVVKTIENVEGVNQAQQYMIEIAQILQVEKVGQIEKTELVPMESTPNSDPSQNTSKELKGTNQLKEKQQLNPLYPVSENQAGNDVNNMGPAQPVQMDKPIDSVGQN